MVEAIAPKGGWWVLICPVPVLAEPQQANSESCIANGEIPYGEAAREHAPALKLKSQDSRGGTIHSPTPQSNPPSRVSWGK